MPLGVTVNCCNFTEPVITYYVKIPGSVCCGLLLCIEKLNNSSLAPGS